LTYKYIISLVVVADSSAAGFCW